MKNRLILIAGMILIGVQASFVKAHTLWINVVPEFDRHVVANIGYGEVMPGSELLTPDWWPMHIERYELYSPDGEKTELSVPKLVTRKKQELKSGVQVQAEGDTGQKKFIISESTDKGTYQIVARTHLTHVVTYLDKEGKKHYADATFMKLPGGAQVVKKKYGINFMQAVFAVDNWSAFKPTGLPLEIVPLSDLHNVRVGDRVQFRVLLNGEPLTKSEPFITAYNSGFGDRWGMHSDLIGGVGEIRVTEAGIWRIDANYAGASDEIKAYRKLEKLPISMESSFVFNVRP